MKIQNQENYLEIEIAAEDSKHLPSYGDAHISLTVFSNGFSGKNDLWVQNESLESFCRSLKELEIKRTGEAQIKSISPYELYLKIMSTDSLGHMAVIGKTGYVVTNSRGGYWHSVEFGFDFDPSILIKIVKTEWVEKYSN